MSPEQLAELRNFFVSLEPQLPHIIADMYNRLLAAVPEARQLFTQDIQEAQRRYLKMLQQLVKLTRSSHLWPVQAGTGTSTIPAVDALGPFHSKMGITHAHFDKMKDTLVECFRENTPEQFTPGAEAALGFIFDVVAKVVENAGSMTAEELARKNKLPSLGEIEPHPRDPEPPRHQHNHHHHNSQHNQENQENQEHRFWEWFVREEDLLFNFERHQERAFRLLHAALHNVSPDLTFEFGPVSDGKRDFVVSAGGLKQAFPAVEALAAAAPALKRWNIVKFRPRRYPVLQLRYGGKTIDPDHVKFAILTNGHELGLYLFFDGYTDAEEEVWGQIGYLLLDEALGEFDVETKVGLIKFFPSNASVNVTRYPFWRLPEMFDEQYAALNRMH